jgi:two-component system sensor kinase
VCRGERGTLQFELVGLKGTRRWLETHAVPFRDERRAETLLLGITRDITEQRNAEQALRESELRFRTLVETSQDAILVRQGERYVYANPAALRLYGVERAGDLLGRPVTDFAHPEDAAWLRERMRRIDREEARLPPREVRLRRADGRIVEVEVTAARSTFNGAPATISVQRDVSERKELLLREKRHAREMRRLLDRMVSAQEADRRRIALELHDVIGQKLTALGIGLNILRHEVDVEPGDALDQRLDHLTGLLEETVDEIRGIVKDLRPPVLDDYGLVAALHWYAERFSGHGGPRVLVRAADPVPRLAPRKELALFRIVQEAVTNAAKHSGGTEVRVGVEAQGGTVRVSIEDNGGAPLAREPAPAPGAEGLGFTAMRERAQSVGGLLRVVPGAAGLRVTAEIPRDDGDTDTAR